MDQNDERWTAVETRDGRFDGRFVYAVQSTKIYCRPSCPSRRPRREYISFFEQSEAACNAGYRPCKRCKPDEDGRKTKGQELAAKACEEMEASPVELSLDALSKLLGVSPYHLQRTFTQVLGVSPKQYSKAIRSRKLQNAVSAQNTTLLAAIFESGHDSISTAYSDAKVMGMTPGQIRRSVRKDATIPVSYSVAESKLGWVGIAATDRGICKVGLYDTADDAARDITSTFPQATMGAAEMIKMAMQAVEDYIEGNGSNLRDIPIDSKGTLFQAKVWQHLRTIPLGSRISYSEVAHALGMPSSVRAVANACGQNEIALFIPCHRVTHKDGSISGYRWGKERKARLLEQESVNRIKRGQPAAKDSL